MNGSFNVLKWDKKKYLKILFDQPATKGLLDSLKHVQ